jgi:hypothetical protein
VRRCGFLKRRTVLSTRKRHVPARGAFFSLLDVSRRGQEPLTTAPTSRSPAPRCASAAPSPITNASDTTSLSSSNRLASQLTTIPRPGIPRNRLYRAFGLRAWRLRLLQLYQICRIRLTKRGRVTSSVIICPRGSRGFPKEDGDRLMLWNRPFLSSAVARMCRAVRLSTNNQTSV